MADYFRFYCDGLDEPRLLYGMHKSPHVVTVWIWVLCECARTKRNQIEQPSSAMLVGLQHKLNVQPGTIQLCLNTLVEIEYLESFEGCYIVRKWNDLQSKYMQEKAWKESHRNQKEPKETKNPIGEERRGEESIKNNTVALASVESDFDIFWAAYPRKVGKSAAMKAWKLAKHPPIYTVLAKIAALKSTDQWRKDNGQFIPHPTTWIRRGGWDDEAVSAASCAASTDDEWSRAYREIAESIWRAQAENYEGGLKRAMQKARDTYGDVPKRNGVDVVNAAIGMAMNNQRPKDWAIQ